MSDEIDEAFDEFLAAGEAPWIVRRNGDGVDGAGGGHLPAGALDLPRLDSAFMANFLSGKSQRNWFLPDFMLLADADPAFRFDVVQRTGEVTPDGKPVNQATLALSLRSEIPANLKHLGAALGPV